MVIDNFDLLERLFDRLESHNDFYMVQVIQRKKDGVDLPSYTSGARTVKNFYFFTKEEYRRQEPYIKDLCKNNSARAYFWINPRNSEEIACECIRRYAELISMKTTNQSVNVVTKAIGNKRCTRYPKLWIVDLDSSDFDYITHIGMIITDCAKDQEDWLELAVPTKNGVHLISHAFNRKQFSEKLAEIGFEPVDVQSDNPTLLYYDR